MKKSKKFLAVLLAICMVMAMSATAFATSPTVAPAKYPLDPNYQPERWVEDSIVALRPSIWVSEDDVECTMPYNNGSGTSGLVIFSFPAESTDLTFNIKWTSAGRYDTYNYRLWRVNGDGIPDTPVGLERAGSFNAPHGYEKLVIGAHYYLVASSQFSSKEDQTCTYSYSC